VQTARTAAARRAARANVRRIIANTGETGCVGGKEWRVSEPKCGEAAKRGAEEVGEIESMTEEMMQGRQEPKATRQWARS
jgi:hypothetical protein